MFYNKFLKVMHSISIHPSIYLSIAISLSSIFISILTADTRILLLSLNSLTNCLKKEKLFYFYLFFIEILSFIFIFIFIYLFIFYCYSITVVCLFSPSLHPTPGEPTSLPHLHPPPWFCPRVLYSS